MSTDVKMIKGQIVTAESSLQKNMIYAENKSKREMWLTFNNEAEKLRFPVLPEKLTVTADGKTESVTIAELGEVLIKQNRTAKSVSWDCFFPATYFPGMNVKSVEAPYSLIEKIEKWTELDGVCHLIVCGTPINLFVLISKFKYWEEGGDAGTVYYSLTLKEFRNTQPKQIEVDGGGNAIIEEESTRVDDRITPTSYVVVKNDSLFSIAKKVLGDSSRWREIYEANKDIFSNPDRIYPGQELIIPG